MAHLKDWLTTCGVQ